MTQLVKRPVRLSLHVEHVAYQVALHAPSPLGREFVERRNLVGISSRGDGLLGQLACLVQPV